MCLHVDLDVGLHLFILCLCRQEALGTVGITGGVSDFILKISLAHNALVGSLSHNHGTIRQI